MKRLESKLKGIDTLIFLDFEGTQLSHEIIAMGAIKVKIDENLNIIKNDYHPFKIYVKAHSPIGEIVREMTGIDESFLSDQGMTWERAIYKFDNYINSHTYKIIVFGNNDIYMINETNRYSYPRNINISKEWPRNIFDFATFMGEFIKDDKGNSLSLVNSLKLFSLKPVGMSHDPLNDALDLKNLFFAFINNTELVKQEYIKQLAKNHKMPDPVKEVMKLVLNKQNVTYDIFEQIVDDYLK